MPSRTTVQHVHEYKEFKEEGCSDNRFYLICECGKYIFWVIDNWDDITPSILLQSFYKGNYKNG